MILESICVGNLYVNKSKNGVTHYMSMRFIKDDLGIKEFRRVCKIETNVLREMVITL